MDKSIKKITDIIENDIAEIESLKKTPNLYESNGYPILIHKKEIFKRVLEILKTSGLT
jgi:hypothetical protein